jgi:hypothetical protein
MERRTLLTALVGVLPLSIVSLPANAQDNGRGKGRNNRENRKDDDRGGDQDSRHFRREDYAVVQRYYSGPRDLPPGLRKKYYRTGRLPRGWEKRIRPFPPELVRVLPPPPPNCERGYIDGVAVVYDRKTRIILDTIDLIGAIAGR